MRRPSSSIAFRTRLRGRRQGIILCYHRVARDRPDPWALCVAPEHFAEQLEVVKAAAEPVPLERFAGDGWPGWRSRRPLVAVTFDDGYADNFLEAKPLLDAADVPATVFVVSGAVGRAREFWWDELERVLLSPVPVPAALQLVTDGQRSTLRLDEGRYTGAHHERHLNWNAIGRVDPLPRHRAFRSAHEALRLASAGERDAAMSALLEGRETDARESHRTLTEEELRLLADGELVEVGAHTVTHPVLSRIPEPDQRWETAQSKSELEVLLGRPVRTFSYPYGGRNDYSETTVSAVRGAGYAVACTTNRDLVYRRTSRFELPRFSVTDCDGEELARALDSWLQH
jgi:peptidoglycan/xylan/chitin deacetylase (PgdA/CDA1 family)